jgi:hypothetical protein
MRGLHWLNFFLAGVGSDLGRPGCRAGSCSSGAAEETTGRARRADDRLRGPDPGASAELHAHAHCGAGCFGYKPWFRRKSRTKPAVCDDWRLCSGKAQGAMCLGRNGLTKREHALRLAQRPTLTAPARADVTEVRVGTKKRKRWATFDKPHTRGHPQVLTSSEPLLTVHRRFAYARLSQPCLMTPIEARLR